ncbi:MAG TPA: neutral zinc metallopeptidase [Thermoanaerobaculia bacterium]|nr:neutral zinc metallopeptidase [Thermoanaerobaculia bacterium]
MRWTPGGSSEDVEDQRGSSGGGGFGGGPLPKLGIGGFLILLLLSFIFKKDFFALIGGGGSPGGAPAQTLPRASSPEEDKLAQFVTFVLNDDQKAWTEIFAKSGKTYRHAKLVLFTNTTHSGCGFAETAMGPFYCPADEKVYIDLGFYRELKDRFGAPGEFAEAYVIAHELGHHVQKLLGISDQVARLQQQNPRRANQLSVPLELQADCFAGVWGYTAKQHDILDPGDLDDGLRAAAAVGDDRIQKQATGQVNPETWTHGSSEQRARWFKTGFDSGDMGRCDTFSGR